MSRDYSRSLSREGYDHYTGGVEAAIKRRKCLLAIVHFIRSQDHFSYES